MIITVTPKYRIQSEAHSWAITEHKGTRKDNGEPRWETVSWHENIPNAICALSERLIREDPLETDSLAEALDRARDIANMVRRSVVRRGGTKLWADRYPKKGAA